ncbi:MULTISPECIES: cytochrome bd-I oxidase subunit CydX [unclassified Ochrobactrum]|jgi:cyd operon protein YbgT|uniref:cytochrome bd-I oxidase subunit CydX n=1 Tax=unclassified Ochrobactrum TaxID=239106 RepID=UPI0030A9C17B
MWYFSWLLGLPLAVAFAVLNAMWYELMDDRARRRLNGDPTAELAREGNKHH